MPALLWLYLTALLYDRTSGSCVVLAGPQIGPYEPHVFRLHRIGFGNGPFHPWDVNAALHKPRHGFLDTSAELTRPCLVNIGSTSNHAASRLHEPLNMYEAEH